MTKSIKEIQNENKLLREMLNNKRRITKKLSASDIIPRKTAAVESHNDVIAARNIGLVGIGGVILSLIVMLIHNIAGTITALVSIGVLAWFTAMRVKKAQYLEQKYGIAPSKVFVGPPKPPQNAPTFKGV